MTAHARLGGSFAHIFMHCPGAAAAAEPFRRETSVYAAEGSVAHEVAELCLKGRGDPHDYVGETFRHDGFSFVVNAEMAEAVRVYVDFVRQTFGRDPSAYEVEARVDLSFVKEGMFGTADLIAFAEGDDGQAQMWVCDYKHGKGVAVDIEDNEQLLYYALGALRRYHNKPVDEVVLSIIQPRHYSTEEAIRTWAVPVSYVEAYGIDLYVAAHSADADDAALNPGRWCRFCPAAGVCPANRDAALRGLGIHFEEGVFILPQTQELNGEDIAAMLQDFPALKNWIRAVERLAEDQIRHGDGIPGYKLVETRARRQWKNEQQAKQALLGSGLDPDAVVKETLISPAQVEGLIGKSKAARAFLSPLVASVSSGTTIAPESDPRPPVVASAEDEFDAA